MHFIIDWLPLFVLGAGLGLFGGIFGIGGGIIAIPILVLGFSFDQATAQGTAAAMMVPNLVIAWYRFARSNPVGFSRQAGGAAALATVTTWFAANLAQYVNQTALQILFGLFLAYLGVTRFTLRQPDGPRRPVSGRYIPLVGIAGGGCMGLLGVGGGLLAAPILTGIFGLRQQAAQTVALAMVTPSAVAGLGAYAAHDRVDWPFALALTAGGVAMVSFGVAIAQSLPERLLQRLFGAMLLFMSVLVVIDALHLY